MIDTHCHIYKSEMSNAEEIIKECYKNNIILILNSVDIETSKEVINLANQYENVYAAIGINYECVDNAKPDDLLELEKLLTNKKVVAIGEIGLDYYWTKDNVERQKDYFIKELRLSKKYDLPVIVHARDSIQDVYDILKKENIKKGSMHCYSGSVEMAKEFIKLGLCIGIDGPITYKNNKKGIEVLNNIDINKLLLETDSPYLSPEPKRGTTNTSLNLPYIVKKISEVKNIKEEDVIKVTDKTARELFKIGE